MANDEPTAISPLALLQAGVGAAYNFGKSNPILAGALGPISILGALVGVNAVTNNNNTGGSNMAGILNIPGIDLLPAGLGGPLVATEAPNTGSVVKTWVANGTVFYQYNNGAIGCYKRNGVFKAWRPYHPLVFGKKINAQGFIRLAKKYRKVHAELSRIFKKSGGGAHYAPHFTHRSSRSKSAPGVMIVE